MRGAAAIMEKGLLPPPAVSFGVVRGAQGKVRMAENERPRKSLKDRAAEMLQDAVEALESLFPAPNPPDLIPVRAPARGRRR